MYVQFTSCVYGEGSKGPDESRTKMYHKIQRVTLREKCPYSESFWSVFSRIRTEYEEILYGISLRIQSKCGKIRTRINPNTSTFHEVQKNVSSYFVQPVPDIPHFCNDELPRLCRFQ